MSPSRRRWASWARTSSERHESVNRILFEKDEIRDGVATFGGERAAHVLQVLHGEVGQVLKTGEIDGPVGTSEIVSISGEAASQPLVENLPSISVRCAHAETSRRPWVDLILAPPRPRVMKRLLPQLAALGVGRIFLVGAKKVEKDFWGATLLKPENYRPLLIDGLMQAGTSILPTLETRRNFRKFVKEELDALFSSSARIVAHPYAKDSDNSIIRLFDYFPSAPGGGSRGRLDGRGGCAPGRTRVCALLAWIAHLAHRHGYGGAVGAADADI